MRLVIDLWLRTRKISLWMALVLALFAVTALALITAGTLAQTFIFDCVQLGDILSVGGLLFPEEREWHSDNCVEEEEEIIWPPLPTPTPRPPVDTCSQLPADILISGHEAFSTQCQRLGAAGVGNDALIARGVLNALDVWAKVDAEVRVCFRARGRLMFLDAATAPRLASDLAEEYVNGLTCGRINRAGTVVLVTGDAPAPVAPAESGDAEPLQAEANIGSTTSCVVETNARLSLRAGPSVYYSRLLSMPEGRRFVARARIGDWFMVNYKGQWGWASGRHLVASPGCEDLDDERAIILPQVIERAAPETDEAMMAPAEGGTQVDTAEMAVEATTDCQLTAVSIINLRAGPGLDYEVLAEIPYQASVSASAQSGDWFKVEYMSDAGWVSREYVFRWGNCDELGEADEMMPAPELSEPEMEAMDMMVEGARPITNCSLRSGDIINLRQGPGLDYAVLAEIPNETNLLAMARASDWFKVEYEAAAGWVHIDYVFRSGACG